MTDKLKDLITSIGEKKGWNVTFTDNNKYLSIANFQRYTTAGQDYSFSIDINDNDPQDFLDRLGEFYNDFDYEEETILWVGEDGHGKNGAPYHLTDILEDMKEVDSSLCKLHESFKKAKDELFNAAHHKIKVQITEYLQREIEINAINDDEAIEKAEHLIDNEEIVLGDEDFTTREYNVI